MNRPCPRCEAFLLSCRYPPSGDPLEGQQEVSCADCGYTFWEPTAGEWREAFHRDLVGLYPTTVNVGPLKELRWGITPARLREALQAMEM